MDQKSNQGTNYAIVDGGMNHLNYLGQMMGMKVPRLSLPHRNGSKDTVKQHYMLCGSLCTTGDVLVRDVELPSLQVEDLLSGTAPRAPEHGGLCLCQGTEDPVSISV